MDADLDIDTVSRGPMHSRRQLLHLALLRIRRHVFHLLIEQKVPAYVALHLGKNAPFSFYYSGWMARYMGCILSGILQVAVALGNFQVAELSSTADLLRMICARTVSWTLAIEISPLCRGFVHMVMPVFMYLEEL
jgi:hypothetical protein